MGRKKGKARARSCSKVFTNTLLLFALFEWLSLSFGGDGAFVSLRFHFRFFVTLLFFFSVSFFSFRCL
jgi:hypothetical protein